MNRSKALLVAGVAVLAVTGGVCAWLLNVPDSPALAPVEAVRAAPETSAALAVAAVPRLRGPRGQLGAPDMMQLAPDAPPPDARDRFKRAAAALAERTINSDNAEAMAAALEREIDQDIAREAVGAAR